jgi:hypothetical protein
MIYNHCPVIYHCKILITHFGFKFSLSKSIFNYAIQCVLARIDPMDENIWDWQVIWDDDIDALVFPPHFAL